MRGLRLEAAGGAPISRGSEGRAREVKLLFVAKAVAAGSGCSRKAAISMAHQDDAWHRGELNSTLHGKKNGEFCTEHSPRGRGRGYPSKTAEQIRCAVAASG